jgi:hypothetical protein
VEGSEVSLGRFFQDLLVQGEIGHCSLQSCVPLFESLEPFCLVEVESALLASPPAISVVGDTDLTYCMTNALAACNGNLDLPELVQDLLRAVTFSWHFCLPSIHPVSDFSTGYVCGGQVKRAPSSDRTDAETCSQH